mmetsp:Transcript_36687/g.59831  ORF Transcript_36687/g.59831 Transcript_36687/m.59831 type:complete len:204 (+) Transcript_36687:322-933(+)
MTKNAPWIVTLMFCPTRSPWGVATSVPSAAATRSNVAPSTTASTPAVDESPSSLTEAAAASASAAAASTEDLSSASVGGGGASTGAGDGGASTGVGDGGAVPWVGEIFSTTHRTQISPSPASGPVKAYHCSCGTACCRPPKATWHEPIRSLALNRSQSQTAMSSGGWLEASGTLMVNSSPQVGSRVFFFVVVLNFCPPQVSTT